MAKPNYSFSKRQREIAKKQKKEEKKARKNTDKDNESQEPQPLSTDDNNMIN